MVKQYLEWIPLTIYAILRNKRRSFAMISGIILGTTILSGIILYTAVLKIENFNTIVSNSPVDVIFNIEGDGFVNETRESLTDLANMMLNDPRVNDFAIFASSTDTFIGEIIIDKTGLGEQKTDLGENVILNDGSISPVFVDNDFHTTEIGKKILKNNFEGNFGEIAVGNSTVIPRSVALKYQLRLGDIISVLNITFVEESDFTPGFIPEVFRGSLTNVKVVGIYEIETGNAGLFTALFERKDVFLPSTLLNTTLPSIQQIILEDQGYSLGIKINEREFKVSDPEEMNKQIDSFINEIVRKAENGEGLDKIKYPKGMQVTGFNYISASLLPFQIFSIFINIFDVLLVAPAVILSLYLLIFGVEMSLEERRREIAIKKVQGADPGQIFKELRNEVLLLYIIGSIIGYIGGIFGAWVISSALGFLKFHLGTFSDFKNFFLLDKSAILWSAIVVGLILAIQIIKKGKSFIEDEISEAVQRYEEKKDGFFRRNNLDILLFGIGVVGVTISILEQKFEYDFKLSFLLSFLINGLGPFMLWIGGSLVGARIAKKVPMKLEGVFLSMIIFKDVARIIQSGLRRRGDTDRLAIIIVLTLSIVTLAAAQGTTDEYHAIRSTEWEVGSDFQLNFALPSNYSLSSLAVNGETVVQESLALGVGPTVTVFSSSFTIVGFNSTKEYNYQNKGNSIGIWHKDSFNDMSAKKALEKLISNPSGVFLSSESLSLLGVEVGDTISLKVQVAGTTRINKLVKILKVKILGKVDHIPGNIGGSTIITNSGLIQKLRALAANQSENAFDGKTMNASRYLVKTKKGLKMSFKDVNLFREVLQQLPFYSSDKSLKMELDNLKSDSGAFGIPGLLSLDFIVSVTAAFISTFAFTAILMERRKREFAVLRAIGAKKIQIYKLAIGESTMMISTSVIWGIIIGSGITYQFNGIFVVFNIFLGAGPLKRLVIFPWVLVILIGIMSIVGMLIATLLSVRSAARQDLSVATRVV